MLNFLYSWSSDVFLSFWCDWKLFSVIVQRDSNMWLSLGGFQEKGPDDEHLRNSHVLVDDTGTIRSVFRKMHLWDSLFWFSLSLLLCLNSTLLPNFVIYANGISRDRISYHMLQSYRVNFYITNLNLEFSNISRFDVDVPGSAVYKESSFTEAGMPLYSF